MCNPRGYTMKISSMYHRLLIYNAKTTTKIDGMGLFNTITYNISPPPLSLEHTLMKDTRCRCMSGTKRVANSYESNAVSMVEA